jgi:hypothetical protein
MTLAIPMFPPRARPDGAPGAVSACPASLILESRPSASQTLASEGEPHTVSPTCSDGAGRTIFNRRTIMNMFVSTAAVAAAPAVAAPTNSPDVVVDHRAILARVEEIIDLLRTRHIQDGWQMDEEGASRALAYFRRHVEGPAFKDEDEDTAEYYAHALPFFNSHGQDLDWIHDGKPFGMICRLASRSPQAMTSAVAPDPIFEAIEVHKAARRAAASVFDVHTMLEKELPRERRCSDVNVWEEKIVETDDPRWIECERAVMKAWEAEDNAAIDLVCIQPTTRAGFLALLDHAVAYDTDGHGWPRGLQSDDGKRTRDWHQFLLENLVAGKRALGLDHPRG